MVSLRIKICRLLSNLELPREVLSIIWTLVSIRTANYDSALLYFWQEVVDYVPDGDVPSDNVLLKVSINFVNHLRLGCLRI